MTGLPIDSVHVQNCQICALANIKRNKFPKQSTNRAIRPLFRIHCDICGPFPVGYGNSLCFITFIDDCSRYIILYFLKQKSNALQCFHEFRTAAEKFFGVPILFLRVDNAGELVEGKFKGYCKANGITYEKTVPDASQQNGVAERANQIIERMCRAMILDSGLSIWFWPLATQAGVHIKNRVPHSTLDSGTTPLFHWFKIKPDLSHLRPFGALTTLRISNSDSLMKLQPRGEEGRFVGYSRDSKGYLIYFPHSKAIRSRRDVIFHGFPIPPTSPVTSETLWKDLPFILEPHFRDHEERIVLEQPHNNNTKTQTPSLYVLSCGFHAILVLTN